MLEVVFLEDALYLNLEGSRDETSVPPEPGAPSVEVSDLAEDLTDDF